MSSVDGNKNDVKSVQTFPVNKSKLQAMFQDNNNNNDSLAPKNQNYKIMEHNGDSDSEWHIESSEYAKNTLNPIRRLIEQMNLQPNPNKPMIALSIGDPTILSDMEKPEIIKDIISKCVQEKHNDSYTPSFGTEKAREAIAKYCSRPPKVIYKAKV